MKTSTYEDFVSFNPCWLTDARKRAKHEKQLARYRAERDEWTALDILRLDDVTAEDRLWLVLRKVRHGLRQGLMSAIGRSAR